MAYSGTCRKIDIQVRVSTSTPWRHCYDVCANVDGGWSSSVCWLWIILLKIHRIAFSRNDIADKATTVFEPILHWVHIKSVFATMLVFCLELNVNDCSLIPSLIHNQCWRLLKLLYSPSTVWSEGLVFVRLALSFLNVLKCISLCSHRGVLKCSDWQSGMTFKVY